MSKVELVVPDFGRIASVGTELRWARDALHPSTTASLDAALLLGHVLSRGRPWLLAHEEVSLSAEEQALYHHLIARRAKGEPVAYLRGYCEWFGMKLRVTRDVLVPRPETEDLVEMAVRVARGRGVNTVADVGTGSGAIAIQLARSLPGARIFALDVSAAALAVARFNVQSMGVSDRVTLLQGSVLETLSTQPDLLVANLPYLSEEAMRELDRDVRQEPDLALYGGRDGLELYRELFRQCRNRGWTTRAVIEIDPSQTFGLKTMLAEELGESRVTVHQDSAGRDRIAVVGA